MKPVEKIPVAVLGATGLVGQRLVALLERHPWFVLTEVLASQRSAGRRYSDAARWLLPGDPPACAARLLVRAAGETVNASLVFSALDAETALRVEPEYAARGHVVVSNASAFRESPFAPLLIPEVNPDALGLLADQPWTPAGGALVCNPNCGVTGLALALKPLHDAFTLKDLTVVTLQALSGAGHPGVASLDALGNVIPFIAGEEEKYASEPQKILGYPFPCAVSVHRVPVADGHTLSVFARFRTQPSAADAAAVLRKFRPPADVAALPSAPSHPLAVLAEPDRPQPLRDLGAGMTVSVGRLRGTSAGLAFTVLVHNTLRGAAGAALLNAELLAARGLAGLPLPRSAAVEKVITALSEAC